MVKNMNDLEKYEKKITDIPLVIESDMFLYPFMIAPIFFSSKMDIKAIDEAMEAKDKMLFVATAKNNDENGEDFYDVGVVGTILRKVILPDNRVKILFQGLSRANILKSELIEIEGTNAPFYIADVEPITHDDYDKKRVDAVLEILKDQLHRLYNIAQSFPQDLLTSIEKTPHPDRIGDLVASALRLRKEQAYAIFKEQNLEERLLKLVAIVSEETNAQRLQKEIKNRVSLQLDKANKEYFLKEQLKQIQKELGMEGGKNGELSEYQKKLEFLKKYMPKDAYKEIAKQIQKLSRMHPDSSDANLLQNYVELVLEIPFDKVSTKALKISEVEKQLNKDHYALKKPKERIVEYFSVKELLQLRGKEDGDSKGTILCFYGPPGVGKTSLANSIATALKRKLVRIALGGMEDISELRGHRRTYIGAMPGRIVQGLIDAKEMNPVIVLDEIDKIHSSYRGDPSSVLLEILDPEQNKEFRDYYTNFNIDLSQAIFIATANDIGQIPAPLRDRMEFININSYTPSQKEQIAKKYLIPQEMKKHGLMHAEVSITQGAIKELIEKYTREAGVRNLRRKIAQILRKVAKEILEGKSEKIVISQKNLSEFLDKIVFEYEGVEKENQIGLVNGLAWTSVGGDVLKIEALKLKGKGALNLTGSLGEVMKESAKIAFSVVKSLIDEGKLKVDINSIPLSQKEKSEKYKPEASDIYHRYDIHLHVPEGATPKDGPSAGIAIGSALASIFSNRAIRSDFAMTGELTLLGKVLPIGGLQEKLIAAYKSGIKEVLIPQKNFERDLEELPQEVKEGLKIHGVSEFSEVLKFVLTK